MNTRLYFNIQDDFMLYTRHFNAHLYILSRSVLMEPRNFKIIQREEHRSSLHYFISGERCIYSSYSSRGNVRYLKCIEKTCKCNGKILNSVFERTNTAIHEHDDHQHRASFEIAYETLRNAVRENPRRRISELHMEILRGLSFEASAMLSWQHVRKTLQRLHFHHLPRCQSLDQLETLLEDENSVVSTTFGHLRDDEFYQGSISGHLFFAINLLIKDLPEILDIYVDATFSVVPFEGRQLLIIMADLAGRPRPIFYVVMRGQSTADYKVVFEHAKVLLSYGSRVVRTPRQATSDFEEAIRSALREVWLGIDLIGCNFHFCQAIRRYARSIPALSNMLEGGLLHHKIMMMFMRISLLPLEEVENAFAEMLNFVGTNGLTDDFQPFTEYFERTWIRRFPIADWCVGDRDRRTNNNLEGYNNKVKKLIPRHPGPWDFLGSLQDLGFDALATYASDLQREAGAPQDRSKITKLLILARAQLHNGGLNNIQFLEVMAGYSRLDNGGVRGRGELP